MYIIIIITGEAFYKYFVGFCVIIIISSSIMLGPRTTMTVTMKAERKRH